MARIKKDSAPNLKLADFTAQRGERADAMMPGDTPIRSRSVIKVPTNKAGITEPIVRTDLK